MAVDTEMLSLGSPSLSSKEGGILVASSDFGWVDKLALFAYSFPGTHQRLSQFPMLAKSRAASN